MYCSSSPSQSYKSNFHFTQIFSASTVMPQVQEPGGEPRESFSLYVQIPWTLASDSFALAIFICFFISKVGSNRTPLSLETTRYDCQISEQSTGHTVRFGFHVNNAQIFSSIWKYLEHTYPGSLPVNPIRDQYVIPNYEDFSCPKANKQQKESHHHPGINHGFLPLSPGPFSSLESGHL